MLHGLLLSLSYFVPAALVGLLALWSAVNLSGLFTRLKTQAEGQKLGVPPLVQIYFRTTIRTLFVTGVLQLGSLTADLVLSLVQPSQFNARLLGYGSGVVLLVCGFTLMVQGGVDRQLKLQTPRLRRGQTFGGLFGITTAVWGIGLVTWQGAIWSL